MGILDKLLNRRALDLANPTALRNLGLFDVTTTGVTVTETSALKYTAVYACVRVLAETVASLPLIIYQSSGTGRQRVPDFYLYSLLHDAPNPLMTSFEFRETLQSHLALWGNAYAEIEIDNAGRVAALWPLRPDKMASIRRESGQLVYKYLLPSGGVVELPGWRVFHLRGLSSDGLIGYSPISLMRQSVGLGMAAEEYGSRLFGNDARPGGILEHPGTLSDEAFDNLKQSWNAAHGGLGNAHRVAILEEGLSFKQVSIPPDDAQFLETRKFQVEEIARIFRVPPHMIQHLERSTFSNIEHQSIDFVVHTVRPWLVRWEQAIRMRLMSEGERLSYSAEFLVDGLLRGDIQSRYDAYATGIQNGFMSRNDVRRLENMNPVKGLDSYLVPLNMAEANSELINQLPAAVERMLDSEETREKAAHERRALRSGQNRHRLQINYAPVYADVIARILRREANDVGNKAKSLGPGAEFDDYVDGFYGDDHQLFITRQMAAVAATYSRLVMGELEKETENEVAETRLQAFIDSYLEAYAARHSKIQASRVKGKEDPDELLEEIESWRDDTRAEQIAKEETTRTNNAIAILAYSVAGYLSKTWLSFGESCPYCKALNGQTIGIELNFISEGQDFFPAGATHALNVSWNIGHPPAHRGCDCMVISA